MNESNTTNIQNNKFNAVPQRFTQKSRTILIMLLASVVCGIIFPMLIVNYYAGLNYSMCAFCLIGALVYVLIDSNDYKLPQLLFWTAIAIVYTSTFLRVRNVVYLSFSFILTPVIFTLMIYFSRKQRSSTPFPQLVETFFSPLVHGFKAIPAVSRIRTKSKKSKALIEVLVGILVSVVLLAIIIPLMFGADAQFANYMTDWFENIFDDFFDYIVGKIVLAVFIIIVYFGYLYIASRHKDYPEAQISTSKGISTNIIFTVLSVVTFVYAFFTISTLFTAITSSANNLPEGMSYTEYARSGFFQLAWLSVINFLILLGAQYLMRNKGKKAKTSAKVIFTIQVVINLCLLGLSAYKMSLYSGAYGLTLLRTLVYIILAYELIMLILLTYKVYNEKFKFITVAVYFSFAFWAIVSFINIESYAIRYNTQHLSVEEFDFSYVCYRTSKDSSSALKDYVMANYDEISRDDRTYIEGYYDINVENFYSKEMYNRDWFEYNYSFNQYSKDRDEMMEFLESK